MTTKEDRCPKQAVYERCPRCMLVHYHTPAASGSRLATPQLQRLAPLLRRIAAAYPDDPGTSDLDSDQPAQSLPLTLKDVRLAQEMLSYGK